MVTVGSANWREEPWRGFPGWGAGNGSPRKGRVTY